LNGNFNLEIMFASIGKPQQEERQNHYKEIKLKGTHRSLAKSTNLIVGKIHKYIPSIYQQP
jgi:hypothetical protein